MSRLAQKYTTAILELPVNLFNFRSPKTRTASSRHSVCRMVVTHITEARFPGSRSPNRSEPQDQASSPRMRDDHYSQSNKIVERIRSVKGSEESPSHVNHSILHEHVLPRYFKQLFKLNKTGLGPSINYVTPTLDNVRPPPNVPLH